MKRLMEESPRAVTAFKEFLAQEYMEGSLDLWLGAKSMLSMERTADQMQLARELHRDHLSQSGKAMEPGEGLIAAVVETPLRIIVRMKRR